MFRQAPILRVLAAALVAATVVGLRPAVGDGQTLLPLVQQPDIRYLGSFKIPSNDGTGVDAGSINYGGTALSVSADGKTLYIGCHDWYSRLAQVTIPPIGGTAAVVSRCTEVPNLADVDPGSGSSYKLGGSLSWNGRTIVAGYSYYDGDANQRASHFVGGTDLSAIIGPWPMTVASGFVSGYMGLIPQEWRGALGGPALTGFCCGAVISRTSFGPAVSVFDPDDVGRVNPIQATELLAYPMDHQPPTDVFNLGGDQVVGVAFPAGTRSVLFVGRRAIGEYCYGTGTDCNDPADNSKGTHGYPYYHDIWAYDANDLLAVRNGQKAPWDPRPYARFRLTEIDDSGGAKVRGAAFDPLSRRLYIAGDYGANPEVHVYEIAAGSAAPPPPQGPTGLGSVIRGTNVSFNWTPPAGSGLTGYQLEAGSVSGAADLAVLGLGAQQNSFSIDAPPGRYFVRLRAINGGGLGPASNEVIVNVGTFASLTGPANLRAGVAGGDVVFYWDPPGDGNAALDYMLEAGSQPGTSDLVQGLSVGADHVYVATGVPPGAYFARLRARYPFGVSQPSNEVAIGVGAPASIPGRPSGLQAQVSPGGNVRLSWNPPTAGSVATGFLIEAGYARGRSDVGQVVVGAGPALVVNGVGRGTYYVRVKALNSAGVSVPSNEVQLTIS